MPVTRGTKVLRAAWEGREFTGCGKKNQVAKPRKGTSLLVPLAAEDTSAL